MKKNFNNLNQKFVSHSKLSWKTMKSLFSSNGTYNANIKLTDKDEIIQNDEELSKHVMLSDVKNEIKDLNQNKATTHNNIPQKTLRLSSKVTANT